jgi:hypothetical protein
MNRKKNLKKHQDKEANRRRRDNGEWRNRSNREKRKEH